MQRFVFALCFVAGICPQSTISNAQEFPSRPVTILVPFPPGGPSDQMARVIGRKLSDSLGQTIVVDNRPGAGAQIAAAALKQAPADGHTLLIGDIGAFAINTTLYSSLSFDPLKDFQPLTLLMQMPMVLVVPQSASANSFAELLGLAKPPAGRLNYASQGAGTGGHLLGEMLRSQSGAQLVHVPYKGAAPALQDLVAGRVDMLFEGVGPALPFVRAGKLKPLAITASRRSSLLPDVPSTEELGYPNLKMNAWFGIVSRAGTPGFAVRKLNEHVVGALGASEVVKRFSDLGFDILPSTPEEFATFMKDEVARWSAVVTASGARVE